MLCLSDHQTIVFKDQSMIPKATFIEIGVYVTVTAKRPGFYRQHHHGNSNITTQDRRLTTWPLSHAFFFHGNYLVTIYTRPTPYHLATKPFTPTGRKIKRCKPSTQNAPGASNNKSTESDNHNNLY